MKNILYYNNQFELKKLDIFSTDLDPKDNSYYLHPITGSTGIQLYFSSNNKVIRQLQFKTRFSESIKIKFNQASHSSDDNIDFTITNSNRIELPPNDIYKPDAQAFVPLESEKLDILFIIDATMQSVSLQNLERSDNDSVYLLDNEKFTEQLNTHIDNFLHSLSDQYIDIRCSVLAFADIATAGIKAINLRPNYDLYPSKSKRNFEKWDEEQLKHKIKDLKGSSGCDYVDALAEALQASFNYNWQDKARKLIYIIGDSPGFSILKPAPVIGGMQANTAIRRYDIDSQLMQLHKSNIEIMTVYVNDSSESELERSIADRDTDKLKIYTKQQYKILASLNRYAQTWLTWKPEETANEFKQLSKQLLGRGYCYPMIKEDCD